MSADGEYKPKNSAQGQGRASAGEEALFVDMNSGVDATREDREAAKSESTGRIAQSESPHSISPSLPTPFPVACAVSRVQ